MSEIDYKDTLNLPKTDFPMKANLASREPARLEVWKKMDIYGQIQKARRDAVPFLLNDGPPYANGDIHIGHALNKILKDIIIKSKTMSGHIAPYIPGWDCHGLPIELQVEKKFGKPGVKIDVNTFRQKCREYATDQINKQRESFKRLGVFGDWENPYVTMAPKFEADIIRTLGKIVKNNHLSRGERPVHWCVHCGSALAEAEVEYKDKVSPSIDVTFKVVDQDKIATLFDAKGSGDISVVIWTTTPWTLPANQAVTLHEKLQYVMVEHDGRRIIVAEELLESCAARYGIDNLNIVGRSDGAKLDKIMLQHPFYDRQVLLILGDHVTTDAGTGCVHTAPAHGNDDYIIGLKYDLPIDNPVNAHGCFFESTPLVAGEYVFKANDKIIEILTERKCLLAHSKLEHSYPHCWRHKEPLIFRATQQWFVSMEKNGLREQALKEIKNVEWIPDWGQARITKMVEGRPDWCISRQRTWGTPLALIVHSETGELHPEIDSIIEKAASLVEEGGMEAWFNLDITDFVSAEDAKIYEKVSDTLDVWFDSGAVHACVADAREELSTPVDLYLEGFDQHRGWFQTSLLSSVAVRGAAPFKEVLTHGFVVDADGHKMSKSLGNVVSPDKVMKTLGADILRLWVAATDYRRELNVSDEILKRTSDSYRRIRNTARFLLANLHGFNPATDLVEIKDMISLDKWILERASIVQEEVKLAYDEYNFTSIYQKVHNFCSEELGSFYLDVIKDRQYTCTANGIPRRSAQTALYYIAEALVRWICPILSFTAEEIWENIPGEREKSVFLTTWSNFPELDRKRVLDGDFWSKVLLIRAQVNVALEEARRNDVIGSALEAEVTISCNKDIAQLLSQLEDELRFVFITSSATIKITNDDNVKVSVAKSPHEKCQRCWHRREDVNKDINHPHVCSRCVENLSEKGEKRVYA